MQKNLKFKNKFDKILKESRMKNKLTDTIKGFRN